MKKFLVIPYKILLLTVLVLYFSCSKNTATLRPPQNSQVTVISDIQYGSNKDLNGNMVNLKLDVYIPANATASQKFPFVFFVHGGSFVTGDKSGAYNSLMTFAQEGFACASIDYRIDSSLDRLTDPCVVDSITTEKSVYMSVQDAKAALRFLVANADKYQIDTSRIFLCGNSAGAITVLNSYYLSQQDFNERVPGIEQELGGINNADNNLTNSFNIIGIAANSGCLPDPSFITSSNVRPTIYFQGGEDSVIPLRQGNAHYCPNSLYVYGTLSLYERGTSLGSPTVIHIDPEGEHGPYDDDFLTSNEICFFNSVLSKKTESGSYTGQASSCP